MLSEEGVDGALLAEDGLLTVDTIQGVHEASVDTCGNRVTDVTVLGTNAEREGLVYFTDDTQVVDLRIGRDLNLTGDFLVHRVLDVLDDVVRLWHFDVNIHGHGHANLNSVGLGNTDLTRDIDGNGNLDFDAVRTRNINWHVHTDLTGHWDGNGHVDWHLVGHRDINIHRLGNTNRNTLLNGDILVCEVRHLALDGLDLDVRDITDRLVFNHAINVDGNLSPDFLWDGHGNLHGNITLLRNGLGYLAGHLNGVGAVDRCGDGHLHRVGAVDGCGHRHLHGHRDITVLRHGHINGHLDGHGHLTGDGDGHGHGHLAGHGHGDGHLTGDFNGVGDFSGNLVGDLLDGCADVVVVGAQLETTITTALDVNLVVSHRGGGSRIISGLESGLDAGVTWVVSGLETIVKTGLVDGHLRCCSSCGLSISSVFAYCHGH